MDDKTIALIDYMYEAAKAAKEDAEADLKLMDDLFRAASLLHDQAHDPQLQAVS